jgi:chorismate lyase/3-hydroxybenzoate synthase
MKGLRIEFARRPPESFADDVLFALEYGPPAGSDSGDDRALRTGLDAADGGYALELWRVAGPVATGVDGCVRFAAGREFASGFIDLDEGCYDGIADAAQEAYRRMLEFQARNPQRHLLRIWNFIDSINEGEGDLERYRQFCVGRARGLGGTPSDRLPAATAVGRRRPSGRMQVCWLAGRAPGRPVENPRQVRAYRYPREYGASPPAFARAMRLETGELMGSGTSSIVGHESRHDGDLACQVEETLKNLAELHRAGGGGGAPTGVKIYVRERAGADGVAHQARAGLPGADCQLIVEADICRRELLVEIECLWI